MPDFIIIDDPDGAEEPDQQNVAEFWESWIEFNPKANFHLGLLRSRSCFDQECLGEPFHPEEDIDDDTTERR